MIKKIKITELKEHPKNSYYFDNIKKDEKAWKEFVEDIEKRGVQNTVIVHDNRDATFTIIAGHQRWKALIELYKNSPVGKGKNFSSVNCEVKEGMTEDEILDHLINDNIQSRSGILGNGIEKQVRLVKYITEKNGLKHGQRKNPEVPMGTSGNAKLSREEMAKELGITKDQLKKLNQLDKVTPEILNLVNNGVSESAIRTVFSKLSKEDQKHFIGKVGFDFVAKSRSALEEQVRLELFEENEKSKHIYDESTKKLQKELMEAKNKTGISEKDKENLEKDIRKEYDDKLKELSKENKKLKSKEDELVKEELELRYQRMDFDKKLNGKSFLNQYLKLAGEIVSNLGSIAERLENVNHIYDKNLTDRDKDSLIRSRKRFIENGEKYLKIIEAAGTLETEIIDTKTIEEVEVIECQ